MIWVNDTDMFLQWFFKLSVWVERTSHGYRPSVFVELMTEDVLHDANTRGVMLLFGMELQAQLLAMMDRAVGRHFASGVPV